jgi:hypothetical protein
MKTSFEQIDEQIAAAQAAPTAETPTSTAVAEAPAGSLVDDSFWGNDGFDGDIDERIVQTPYLELVHGVGKLSEAGYSPGQLVYNKETVMATPKMGKMDPADGASVIILKGFIEYAEDVSQDEWTEGVRPRKSRKEADLRAFGLVTAKEKRESSDPDARTFRPLMNIKVLVEAKDGAVFPFDAPNGKTYALAAVSLTKGSYWAAGKVLGTYFNNDVRLTRKPITWKTFKLFTQQFKASGSPNSVWSIHAKPERVNDEALLKWIAELGV